MKISIIVPVYNGEKYLERCLNSLVNQTYKNIEIIVVNDGSIDNSLNILNDYKKKDNRFIIINKKNEGQAIARNIGINHSSGDYILFVDCDDYIDLGMIENLYRIAQKEKADIVVCNLETINDIGKRDIILGFSHITCDDKKNFVLSDPGPAAKLFKSKMLKKSNFKFFENHIYEDLATIPSLAVWADKIAYIDEAYYKYVIHDNSTMNQTKFNNKLNDIFDSLENLSTLLDDKFEEELEFIYIKHLLHDASLRFLKFNNKQSKESLNKVINVMKNKYPKWMNNKYLDSFSKKELLLTKIIYKRMFWAYRLYRKVFN